MPALTEGGRGGANGEMEVVGKMGGGTGVLGETRVRWHSARRAGMEEAGRRDGSEKAWIEVKRLEA